MAKSKVALARLRGQWGAFGINKVAILFFSSYLRQAFYEIIMIIVNCHPLNTVNVKNVNEAPSQGHLLTDTTPKYGGRRLIETVPMSKCKSPLISVVTVVYNGSAQLRSTIESVLQQKMSEIEHIVIDGGSTDGTCDVLHEFDNRLDYWVSEPDDGIYDAMNKALTLCNGEYVHFLNAGDRYCSPSTLQRVSTLLALQPALLMNRVHGVKIDGGIILLPKTLGLNGCRHLFNSAYCHQGAVARTSLLQTIGFDRTYVHFADFYALMRVREMSALVLETSEVVVDFPLDGISSNWRKAPTLYAEKERLLSSLGEPQSNWMYWFGFLRAHFYRLKMAIRPI